MLVNWIWILGLTMGVASHVVSSMIWRGVIFGAIGLVMSVMSMRVERRLVNTYRTDVDAYRALTYRLESLNEELLARLESARAEFHGSIDSAVLVRDVASFGAVPGVTRATVVALDAVARASVDFDVGDEIFVETSPALGQFRPVDFLLISHRAVLAFTRSGVTTTEMPS